MKHKSLLRKIVSPGLLLLLLLNASLSRSQSISITAPGAPVSENFNTLSNTAGSTTNVLTINGWYLSESGGGARDNGQYAVDDGGSTTGDTYSYGTAAAVDRALGGSRTGTLIPIFGASFTNNTGTTITTLVITYTGEQWRLGTTGRTDQLNFEYSTNATSLITGTYTGVAALNFVSPNTAVAPGALDGNLSLNRKVINSTITGLSIPNGATFWIRWTDTDATGTDDGLAIDNFSLTTPFVIGTIPKGDSIIIRHDVTIDANPPFGTDHVAAQWTVQGSNFSTFISDDPDTGTPLDSTLTLIELCPTIVVTNPGVTTGTAGVPFSQQFNASGGTGPYTFTTASPLPTGLTLSTGGLLAGTPIQAGTFPIVVKATDIGPGACSGNSPTYNLVISCPAPITVTATPSSQIICSGTAIANIQLSGGPAGTVYNWTRDMTGSVTGIATPGLGDITGTLTNTTTAPVIVTFTIIPTYYGTCIGNTITATVTVNPAPNVTVPTDKIYCAGTPVGAGVLNFTTTNTPGSSTTYSWSNSNGAIGLGTGPFTANSLPAFTATNGTTAPISGIITVTPTYTNTLGGPACTGPSQQFTITVNPAPNVTVPSSPQIFCNGTAVPAATLNFTTSNTGGTTTFSWSNSNGAIGLATGPVTGSSLPAFTATNGTTAPISGVITVTPTYTNAGGGPACTGPSQQFTIIVNPAPNVTVPTSKVYCAGTLVTTGTLNFTTTNTPVGSTTYSWSNSNGAIGLATGPLPGSSLPTFTATNATGAPISGIITVTPTYTNALGLPACAGPSQQFTITVNPVPNAVATPSSQTTCSGQTIAPILLTGNVPLTVFSWSRNMTGTVTGIANNGTGDITGALTNTTAAPITVTFSIIPTYTNAGLTCQGTTIFATVLVNPTPDAVATPPAQTICSGSSITPIVLTGSVSNTVFNWTRNNPAVTGIASPGVGDISGSLTNSSNVAVTVTFVITPTANGCVPGSPVNATVVVNPIPAVNAVASSVYCVGASVPSVVFGSNVSGATFSWSRSGQAIGLAPTNGTGNVPAFTATNSGSAPLTATFSVTASYNNAGLTCTGATIQFTITVNPVATVTPVASQAVCNNALTTAIGFSSPTTGGTIVYNWTNNKPSIGLGPNGIGDIPAFTAINTSNIAVTALITVTPAYTSGGVTCTGTPITFNITVNPTPFVDAVTNKTYCVGAAVPSVVFTSTVAGATFSWSRSGEAIGLGVTGGTGNVPAFTATNSGSAPLTSTFTVMASYTNGGVTCTGPSIQFTITINPVATVNAVASQTVCDGGLTAPVSFSSPTTGGTIVYNWTNNTPSINLPANGSGNIAAFNATNAGNAPVTATITVTPSYTNGGLTCTGTPITFTITVNPTAKINPVANQILCNGSLSTLVNFTSPTSGGTIVYNWVNNTTSIGLGPNGVGDITPFTATNAGTAPVTATIIVTPSYTNGSVTCVGLPITFTITVNPAPNVTVPTSPKIYCNGTVITTGTLNFTTTNTGGTTTFSWTNSNTNIGLAAGPVTGNSLPTFTATNATTAPISGIITVTPTYINAGGGPACTGPSQQFTITVNPAPNVIVPSSPQTFCNNTSVPTGTMNFSTTNTPAASTTYSWTNSNTAIGLPAGPVTGNSLPTFTATNGTTVPISGIITVTPTYTNAGGGPACTGPSQQFTITVNPTPTVTCPANITINNTPGTCGAVVTYPPATATGTPAPTISYSIPSGSTFPVGTTTVVVTASNICGTVTCSFTVRVIDIQPPVITCPSNISVTAIGACTAVVTYAVTATDNCTGTVITRTAGLASGSAFPLGVTTVTHVATDASGLTSTCSFTVTVLDGQIPVITVHPVSRNACSGTNTTFNVTATLAVSYQWQIWNGVTWVNVAGATASSYTATNVTTNADYRVVVTGLCTPVISNMATVFVLPLPVVSLTASIPPILLPGQLLTITAVTSPSGGSYAWFKNGVLIPGATGSSLTNLTVSDIGTYRVVYTDLNGCISASADLVVSALITNNLYIYPNPNNGHFHVRFYNQPGEVATVRILDMRGAEVYHIHALTTLPYTDIDINVSDASRITPGAVYLVEVSSGNPVRLIGTKTVLIIR